MKPYNPQIDYLGPNGSWLSKFIPKVPPTCQVLHPLWNRVAYEHDIDYSGSEFKGFFGWLRKIMNREAVEEDRLYSDTKFRNGLRNAVESMRSQLTPTQYDLAIWYAEKCYFAVHKAGWAFYKTGGEM